MAQHRDVVRLARMHLAVGLRRGTERLGEPVQVRGIGIADDRLIAVVLGDDHQDVVVARELIGVVVGAAWAPSGLGRGRAR